MLLGKESYNDLLFRRLFWLKDEGKWEKLNLQAESSARRWLANVQGECVDLHTHTHTHTHARTHAHTHILSLPRSY